MLYPTIFVKKTFKNKKMQVLIFLAFALFFIIIFSSLFISKPNYIVKAENTTSPTKWAKIKSGALLYKTRDSLKTTYDNVYFILPQSYFVELLENNTSEIIKVKYGSIIGYAKQSHLTRVDFIPKKPTLDDVTFNIGNISTQLRKTPDTNDDKIVTILESGTTGINYIAEISGTIPSGQTTSTWYFAEYTPTFDPTSVYRGYVHKSKTIAMGIIEVNLEDNPIINMPDNSQASGKGITKISTTTKIILIVLVTLPSIIIIALLVAHKKKTQNLNDAPVNNLQIPSELLQKHAINKQNGEKCIKQENNSFRLKSKKVKDLEEHIKEFGEKNIDNVRKSDKTIDQKSEEKTMSFLLKEKQKTPQKYIERQFDSSAIFASTDENDLL